MRSITSSDAFVASDPSDSAIKLIIRTPEVFLFLGFLEPLNSSSESELIRLIGPSLMFAVDKIIIQKRMNYLLDCRLVKSPGPGDGPEERDRTEIRTAAPVRPKFKLRLDWRALA